MKNTKELKAFMAETFLDASATLSVTSYIIFYFLLPTSHFLLPTSHFLLFYLHLSLLASRLYLRIGGVYCGGNGICKMTILFGILLFHQG